MLKRSPVFLLPHLRSRDSAGWGACFKVELMAKIDNAAARPGMRKSLFRDAGQCLSCRETGFPAARNGLFRVTGTALPCHNIASFEAQSSVIA